MDVALGAYHSIEQDKGTEKKEKGLFKKKLTMKNLINISLQQKNEQNTWIKFHIIRDPFHVL